MVTTSAVWTVTVPVLVAVTAAVFRPPAEVHAVTTAVTGNAAAGGVSAAAGRCSVFFTFAVVPMALGAGALAGDPPLLHAVVDAISVAMIGAMVWRFMSGSVPPACGGRYGARFGQFALTIWH